MQICPGGHLLEIEKKNLQRPKILSFLVTTHLQRQTIFKIFFTAQKRILVLLILFLYNVGQKAENDISVKGTLILTWENSATTNWVWLNIMAIFYEKTQFHEINLYLTTHFYQLFYAVHFAMAAFQGIASV